jgi:cell division septation protein DedD
MDQPMLFYIAPKNEPPLPVAPVSQEQLDIWALETDIASFGTGAIRQGGKWRVSLVEANNQGDALRVYNQLRSAGYAAEIRSEKTKAGLVFRVRISNLPNQREAAVLAVKLRGQMGITEPKVSM